MKIKKMYFNDKYYLKKWLIIVFIIYALGMILGSVYSLTLNTSENISINSYLNNYFNSINTKNSFFDILKSTLFKDFRIYALIILLSFIRPGFIGILLLLATEGFISGFTYSSFIKLYSFRGLFLCLFDLPSTVLFVLAISFLSSSGIIFSTNKHKNDKLKIRQFILLSFCCLAIFCVAALFDAFISTTFMKAFFEKFIL